MKKSLVIMLMMFASCTGLVQQSVAQAAGQPAQSGQAAPKKEIKDPAEYNAYVNAYQQQNPVMKAQALEAFLQTYPNTVMKEDALELLMVAYQQANDAQKALDAATRVLQVNPNNIRAAGMLGGTRTGVDGTVLLPSAESPSIPEEARKHFVMGATLFKDAKTSDDFGQVESQFKQAVDLAPQWPEARYNLALAKEAAGDYSGAMADLKLYQQFKLSETEGRTVQDKIYALEAKADVAAKEQAKAREVADAKLAAETFRGTWYGSQCFRGKMSLASLARGCTGDEKREANWQDFSLNGAAIGVSFEIENDGTVKMNGYSDWAGCKGDVFGIPHGSDPWRVRWEVRPKDGPPRQIWSDAAADGSSVEISCNRPLDGPTTGGIFAVPAYNYVHWSRKP